MANGTVYRRDDRKKPWVVHVSWLEGEGGCCWLEPQ